MTTFLITMMIITVLFVGYMLYQIKRNHTVYDIRINWINTDDDRWNVYSYQEMFVPSKSNWYGFKFPKDSDFK